MTSSTPTTYLLPRDRFEATRLSSQHLLWQLHTSYLLHPDIPLKDGMTIADIGTGTGIWALELSPHLPPNAQVVGYDIASTHLPAPEYWPANVRFDHLDSLSETIPEELIGHFDVVHLRMWAFVIRDNDPSALIRHAERLLRGYLQWEDARFGSIVTREGDETALRFRELMRRKWTVTKHNFQWLDELDRHVNRRAGLEVVDCQYKPWAPSLIPLVTNTFMLALESSSALLERPKQAAPSVPSQEEWLDALAALYEEIQKPGGAQFHWLPVSVLARKSS
ncbi:class I SAM-dependent methyltransferase [Aspergillus aculeatinus CBS 121060]|uniref:S-adenosyl-L-methionine-dependent methyltransferase n=1 Tax=Aspergillus aculeatinus CBS 121060 TaxID=1448322 RepID=A0ACD1H9Q1_9EURO|nr:S-adenosyl-L-methionine-dependent methyltransferase [Aspergillus aculeatinus CBS 121060]RAH70365.1 S-adenosyl-L-methionine-dependent methyltransferase [Aspergillus aculeatinus CBS 121060]